MAGTDGLFGSPLYVAASYAFLFVLFGNFYVLAGGGRLFFDVAAALTGRMTGEFVAIEESSGKVLWQFQTGSGINAPAVTYTYKGRQYVTVLSGLAGDSRGRRASAKVTTGPLPGPR